MKYKWSKANSAHLLKVFVYSAVSSVLGVAIVMLSNTEFPPQYMFLVPIVNSALVAVKEFLSEER